MTLTSPTKMHSADVPKRPKGILKNSSSYTGESSVSPTATTHPELTQATTEPLEPQVSDKDLTLQNTLQNAGHRRSSSAAAHGPMSRRRSSQGALPSEENPRLKWDEANLYLAEQEKSATMKIDEPKTPYAKRYDPAEDEDEMRTLDAQELVVDELDRARENKKEKHARESDIPGLELGEPEEAVPEGAAKDQVAAVGGEPMALSRSNSGKEKSVEIDPPAAQGEYAGMNREEAEKHKKFEEMRKKHYEMKDIKDMLGHPEKIDDMDEEDDAPAPPMPTLATRQKLVNGS